MDRLACSVLLGIHLFSIGVASIFPVLLLAHGETNAGRWVGLAFALLITGTLSLWLFRFANTKQWAPRAILLVLMLAAICFAKAFLLTPAHPDSGGAFREHYQNQTHYRRASLAQLVPEIDQLKLGSYLFGVTDPFIDNGQAQALRKNLSKVYGELRTDTDFRDSSSVLGMAYKDLFLVQRNKRHFYEYRPEKAHGGVLIFLHGSLGNFKGYVWSLKETADALGITILAPTYGMGNWQHDKECSRVSEMIAYCQTDDTLINKRLYLGGISNGGRGCLRAVQQFGSSFAGVILISPVMESHLIDSPSFQSASLGLPFLILHGTDDRRIPFHSIRKTVKMLENIGARVELRSWEGEDHFLMFQKRDALKSILAPWIQAQESAGGTGENL